MITEIEIAELKNEEYIIASFTWDENYRYVCSVEDFKLWIDSTYELEEYKEQYEFDYGEGEYGWERMVNWDYCFEHYFLPKYVDQYIKKNKIIPNNLQYVYG